MPIPASASLIPSSSSSIDVISNIIPPPTSSSIPSLTIKPSAVHKSSEGLTLARDIYNITNNCLTLKNGATVHKGVVTTTFEALKKLSDNVIAVYELHQKCLDPKHKMFGNTEEIVRKYGLISDAGIHDSTRDVILSSISGKDLDLKITYPIAE